MLVELRFEVAGLAPRVRQLAFERAEVRFSRLDLGRRVEHRSADLLRRGTMYRDLIDNFREATTRLLFSKRKLIEARVRGAHQFRDFSNSPARIAAMTSADGD